MTHLSAKLASLATDLMQSIPPEAADLRGYINDISLGYIIEGHVTTWPKPEPMPYYGEAFADALNAIERGWEGRIKYYKDRVAAAVRKAGGVLQPVKRIERRTGGNPQPTDRREFDNGYTPRTGKE